MERIKLKPVKQPGESLSSFMKRVWASRSLVERKEIGARAFASIRKLEANEPGWRAKREINRLAALRSPEVIARSSKLGKERAALKSPEELRAWSAMITSVPHNYSDEFRLSQGERTRRNAAKTIAEGKRWGGGGSTKGIKVGSNPKQRDGILRAIEEGRFSPQNNAHGSRSVVTCRFGIIKCHSSWEALRVAYFSSDLRVISLIKEPFRIKYIDEDLQTRLYLPDFLIEYFDGKRILEEIKPEHQWEEPLNLLKFEAARKFCSSLDIEFRVVGEKEIGI